MKLKTLMIGDFVYINGMLRRVDAIHDKKVGYHTRSDRMDWAYWNEIEPVNITKEFIEKNFTCFPWKLEIEGYFFGLPLSEQEGDTCAVSVEEIDGNIVLYPFCDVLGLKYVHEFQNFINLLGIDLKLDISCYGQTGG